MAEAVLHRFTTWTLLDGESAYASQIEREFRDVISEFLHQNVDHMQSDFESQGFSEIAKFRELFSDKS
ncbi:MAG: hypothetical protein JRN15_13235 [Nitrososphaerota archaeon]|nr:hypothetical protein [Nitrososphaerota archaeon]